MAPRKNQNDNAATAEVEDSITALAELVETAEAQHRERVEDARANAARAKAKISQAEADAEAAKDAVADIVSAWNAGDEGPSALDHATAQSEVVRSEALAQACKRRAKTLTDVADKATTDSAPARVVAEVLRHALGQGPVILAVCAEIREIPAGIDRPVIVCRAIESKGSGGRVSGVVEVTAHRPSWAGAVLDPARVSSSANTLGADLAVSRGRSTDSTEVARITLVSGTERTPVLDRDPTDRDARGLVQDVARRILLAQIENRGAVSLTPAGGLSTSMIRE